MKGFLTLLIASYICTVADASAQELSADRSSIPHSVSPAMLWRPTLKLQHHTQQWESLTQVSQPLSQQSLLPEVLRRNKRMERRQNRDARLWEATIGNTGSNWSLYPDRALDARALTFPLPKKGQQPRK